MCYYIQQLGNLIIASESDMREKNFNTGALIGQVRGFPYSLRSLKVHLGL